MHHLHPHHLTHVTRASCASSSSSFDSRKVRELRTFFRRVLGHPGPWPTLDDLGIRSFPCSQYGCAYALAYACSLYPVPALPCTRALPIPYSPDGWRPKFSTRLPSFGQDDVAQDTPDHFRATSIQSCLYASCSATQWNRLTVTCCYVFEHPQQFLLVRRVVASCLQPIKTRHDAHSRPHSYNSFLLVWRKKCCISGLLTSCTARNSYPP